MRIGVISGNWLSFMQPVPPELRSRFLAALGARGVPQERVGYRLKWLRYYLDFCEKYRQLAGDPDSLTPFGSFCCLSADLPAV